MNSRRRGRVRLAALAALSLGLVSVVAGGSVWGAFGAGSANAGNTITAAADFLAPTSSATMIAKAAGGVPGYIRPGGTYYVYANVADSGNPASGVASVTADVSSISSGQTAAALAAGSFTVGGVSYNRRSASLTAAAALAEGSAPYSLTMTDAAGNSATLGSLSVTVDNTPPSAADIQTANGSTIVGRAQQGDTITYTFSEPPEPESILAGWGGAATPVVVRLNNGASDTVTIYNAANAIQLPLGTVDLGRTGYTTSNITFGATGTASSMVLSGSTIVVTLGTQSAAATTVSGNGKMIWTPSATATDRAGNAMSTAPKTSSTSPNKEF
ncbi:MAG: hypothetical protein ACM3NV_05205 [Syntrophothermus sp.]